MKRLNGKQTVLVETGRIAVHFFDQVCNSIRFAPTSYEFHVRIADDNDFEIHFHQIFYQFPNSSYFGYGRYRCSYLIFWNVKFVQNFENLGHVLSPSIVRAVQHFNVIGNCEGFRNQITSNYVAVIVDDCMIEVECG